MPLLPTAAPNWRRWYDLWDTDFADERGSRSVQSVFICVQKKWELAMSDRPMMPGACCAKSDDSVTQLRLDEGRTVGVMGLNAVFEQLWAMGRKPDEIQKHCSDPLSPS